MDQAMKRKLQKAANLLGEVAALLDADADACVNPSSPTEEEMQIQEIWEHAYSGHVALELLLRK